MCLSVIQQSYISCLSFNLKGINWICDEEEGAVEAAMNKHYITSLPLYFPILSGLEKLLCTGGRQEKKNRKLEAHWLPCMVACQKWVTGSLQTTAPTEFSSKGLGMCWCRVQTRFGSSCCSCQTDGGSGCEWEGYQTRENFHKVNGYGCQTNFFESLSCLYVDCISEQGSSLLTFDRRWVSIGKGPG